MLGSGWGAISLCQQIDKKKYEVVWNRMISLVHLELNEDLMNACMHMISHVSNMLWVQVCVSPRNYFLMTPLLPSVSVGTLETRAVCEPGMGAV